MVSLSILEDASEDILQDLAIIKGTNHWIKVCDIIFIAFLLPIIWNF